jgi:hypothetical protein
MRILFLLSKFIFHIALSLAIFFAVYLYVITPAKSEESMFKQQLSRLETKTSKTKVFNQKKSTTFFYEEDLLSQEALKNKLSALVAQDEDTHIIRIGELDKEGLLTNSRKIPTKMNTLFDVDSGERTIIFQHTVQITIESDYSGLIQFLTSLKADGIFWQSIDYKVTSYPQAQVVMEVSVYDTK